jgi:16S rRNA (adenine1518-N6/adenine1519-N6)-dimethyltransferase
MSRESNVVYKNMTEKFEHKKSLGQHFLTSNYAPKKMCDAANLHEGDVVLEIGPGTGILTKEILARGAKVVAIEADLRAVKSLQDSFPTEIALKQLTIHHHDARELHLNDFGLQDKAFKVVSNIPYYLSGFLFRNLLDSDCQPNTLVFLIQKEVATRIARDPKESLLSLSIKIFGDPTYICTVKRGHFTPPPKIDSAIVAVNNISQNHFKTVKAADFFKIIHLGFAQKRKQLLGNLSKSYQRDIIEAIFVELQLPLTVRAEDIPIETWILLTVKLSLAD